MPFLVKEGNKSLNIILFAYSRGAGKSLFRGSRPKGMRVVSICLHQLKAIVRNQFFFINFAFVYSE